MNQVSQPLDVLDALAAKVYIVGAGPGDPELLTVKAQRIIANADVILFADSLVPKQIVEMARNDAELVRTANKTLENILPLMIDRVRSGYRAERRRRTLDRRGTGTARPDGPRSCAALWRRPA